MHTNNNNQFIFCWIEDKSWIWMHTKTNSYSAGFYIYGVQSTMSVWLQAIHKKRINRCSQLVHHECTEIIHVCFSPFLPHERNGHIMWLLRLVEDYYAHARSRSYRRPCPSWKETLGSGSMWLQLVHIPCNRLAEQQIIYSVCENNSWDEKQVYIYSIHYK